MKMLIVVSLVLAGCAAKPIVWDHPEHPVTATQFAQDRYQCDQETASRGNYFAAGAPLFIAIAASAAQKQRVAVFQECMEARGYTKE